MASPFSSTDLGIWRP